jgi:CRISPR-associated endoribonuclease Cas6
MRIYLTTTPSRRLFPYNYQKRLTGAIHKWLGADNAIHGQTALFSFSGLNRAVAASNAGLRFPDGAQWFISAFDPELLKRLIKGINADPIVMEDMVVNEIIIQEDPAFGEARIFKVGSPVLVKQKLSLSQTHHCVFSESIADEILTNVLRFKLAKAGLNNENVRVEFQRQYQGAKTKLIQYDGIGNKVNVCPIAIHGSPTQLAFAWNVGVGHSTGIGFGSLI